MIDFHAHIFREVDGQNPAGPVRSERFGRIDNAGVLKPFIPPLCEKTAFPVDNLAEMMRQNGVEQALLLQNPTIGTRNDEIADAMAAYPGMFFGVVQDDPFGDTLLPTIERYGGMPGFIALKLELSHDWGWTGIHGMETFDYEKLYPAVELAGSLGLAVIIDTGSHVGPAYQPDGIGKLARQFPHTRFVIEHLGYFIPGAPRGQWEELIALGGLDNVCFGISAVGQLLAEAYPCPNAMKLVAYAHKKLGAGKLLWGSDVPTTLTRYTYRQMIDTVQKHAHFLSDAEKEQVLGGNAKEILAQKG